MPIYEYQCSECGERFDKWVRSMCCDEETLCPKCGGRKVKKAVSLFGTCGSTSGGSLSDSSCAPTSGG
jgi:putative FmdB family regulatory protein